MKEFEPLSLETQAIDIINSERRLALEANKKRDSVTLTKHILNYEIMESFALQLGILTKPIDKLNSDP